MVCYGNSYPVKKNYYHFSEHGVGFKINSMRLGETALVVSKYIEIEYENTAQRARKEKTYISFGLLSSEFIENTNSANLVAPVACFELLGNSQSYQSLMPNSENFL